MYLTQNQTSLNICDNNDPKLLMRGSRIAPHENYPCWYELPGNYGVQ